MATAASGSGGFDMRASEMSRGDAISMLPVSLRRTHAAAIPTVTVLLYPWYEVSSTWRLMRGRPAVPRIGCVVSIPTLTEADEMVDQQKMRASDRDRQQVVEQLRGALEDGRLAMEEYMDRMAAAYQAATYGDLAPLCADLPASSPMIAGPQTAVAAASAPAVSSRAGYLAGLPVALKVLWTIWLAAVSVNVVVWSLVSVTSGHLAYPWPVWVAGPYGAVLFALSAGAALFRRSRPPVAPLRPVNG
jgi:hypothetical protein